MTKLRPFTSIDAFRRAARAGSVKSGEAQIRAFVPTKLKANPDSRTVDFTISTESIDRYGDTIRADGWRLENYRRNPVVLWMHEATMLPVARATKVWTERLTLKARTEFTPAGLVQFNDHIFDLLSDGFLNATSVGFLPLKWAWVDEGERFGIDFIEQELLEFSVVTVPANPEALVDARSAQSERLRKRRQRELDLIEIRLGS